MKKLLTPTLPRTRLSMAALTIVTIALMAITATVGLTNAQITSGTSYTDQTSNDQTLKGGVQMLER